MRAGIYRHRKGGLYLVLGVGHDSDHEGREVVVYVPLYVRPGPRLAVRTRSEFEDRFEFIGEHMPDDTAVESAPATREAEDPRPCTRGERACTCGTEGTRYTLGVSADCPTHSPLTRSGGTDTARGDTP